MELLYCSIRMDKKDKKDFLNTTVKIARISNGMKIENEKLKDNTNLTLQWANGIIITWMVASNQLMRFKRERIICGSFFCLIHSIRKQFPMEMES